MTKPRVLLTATLLSALIGTGAAAGAVAHGAAARVRTRPASLMLDFTPNAIHTGIYAALARHLDAANGLALHVRIPGASTDAISLLSAGRVDFAILDIHDLAIADARGQHLVGIMALEQRPLAAVIAQPRFTSPRQLDGRTIGVTGAPSDLAVLRSIVAGAGGRPQTLRTLTIGYDAVPDLLSGRVAAATAFWNDEGVQLTHLGPGHRPFRVFRVDQFGAPSYPELVLCATARELRRAPGLARRVVRTLVEGYRFVLHHPLQGEHDLESEVSGLSPHAVALQLAAELPAFLPRHGGAYGSLSPTVLAAWARWERRFGIVRRTPDVAAMFNRSFLPG
ncbi:MAG TPA: ABC transporter substrate-binding protein [Solirubrobacteraceae bacterium]|nr:ABC transporter substrate-binding protein [Solirubrobacteraceae bacterium]